MAREGAHERVEEILRSSARGRLLDVPTGHGALAVRLKQIGFDVVGCDLYPQIFDAEGIEITAGDLDAALPYDDQSFEYVVCIEGLEHIENPSNAIREFSRLLKPGGTLVVSVPNILNIEERLKWLFTGYTSHFKPLSNEARLAIARDYGGIEEVALHVNPIGYSEVRFLLERSGFELQAVHLDQKKKNSWMFFPIVFLIRLAARFSSTAKRRERWTEELNADEVLLGRQYHDLRGEKIMSKLSHYDEAGRVKMVDVSAKEVTTRRAVASCKVLLSGKTLEVLRSQTNPKGDPLEIARIAGIMAAKKTAELIPLCHQINLSKVNVTAEILDFGIHIEAEAVTDAKTGVEMEALTAVSVAALTIYDMCKAVQKDIEITDIRLERKSGGKEEYGRQ